MFLLFVLLRFYSKTLQRLLFLVSSRDRLILKNNKYLSSPLNIKAYEDVYHSISDFKLNSDIARLKEYAKNSSYNELVSMHIYYNVVLNVHSSTCIYHEILRRNSKISSVLRPFGFRRFIAAQIMLGGIGISTWLNRVYSKELITVLCFLSAFDNNKEYNKFVRGKSISLCGGAPSPRKNFEDVLSNDLVVRLNKHQVSNEKDDIIYFRSERLSHLAKSGSLKNLSKIHCWLSIKTFRYYARLRYFDRLKNIVPTVSLDAAFDCGKLNAIPTAALDLIARSVGVVYVFDTDLNLSKKHKEGYRSSDLPDINFKHIFGDHPSYIQFTVLRYLYIKGYVKFEDNPNFDINWKYSKFVHVFSKVYS
jgi:hypothetical protein